MMTIIETLTGKPTEVSVVIIDDNDFKKLSKKRYFFDWKLYKTGYLVYKLTKVDDDDILGVMAVIDVPTELRMEISLICCSRENYAHGKQYDKITGNLIACACTEAVKKYGRDAAVSLIPKTEIREHYKRKYGMQEGGKQVFLFGENLKALIKQYIE